MSQRKQYYVYIMASRSRVIYTGVTNNVKARVEQHKSGMVKGFSSRYDTTMLVHVESTEDVLAAIEREKQIKGWLRTKKVALIEDTNPDWSDLSEELFGDRRDSSLRSE